MTTRPTAIRLRPYRATLDLVVGANTVPTSAHDTRRHEDTDQFLRRRVQASRTTPRPVLFITTDDDRLVPPEESIEPQGAGLRRGHAGHARVVRGAPAGPSKNRVSAVQGDAGRLAAGGL